MSQKYYCPYYQALKLVFLRKRARERGLEIRLSSQDKYQDYFCIVDTRTHAVVNNPNEMPLADIAKWLDDTEEEPKVVPKIDFMIDAALTTQSRADEIRDTIIFLSERPISTAALISAFQDEILSAEMQWREIEARPEYKFASRYDAQKDYLCRSEEIEHY